MNDSERRIALFYHKNQQEFAGKICSYLKERNYSIWIDVKDESQREMMNVAVCILSPMFESSKCYENDLKFIKQKQIPIIAIRILPNWKPFGWLQKILQRSPIINFCGLNPKNSHEYFQKLENKINCLLESNTRLQLFADESFIEPSKDKISSLENLNSNYSKKKAIQYVNLPFEHCSSLMICNDEYILLHANQTFHLFDKNFKLIRSNKTSKINENDLKDLNWCDDLNSFIILTRKDVYFVNPLTIQLNLIENFKIKNFRDEYISCSYSNERFYLIKYQYDTKFYSLEQYQFPSFRFQNKFSIVNLIKKNFSIQNGFSNEHFIEEILSMKHFQNRLLILMKISYQWFIFVFDLFDQPIYSTRILVEEKSRLIVLNPLNQLILYNESLSNSFLQISIRCKEDQQLYFEDLSKGFIDFHGQLRSIALCGLTNLILLVDHALLLYKL